MLKLFIVAALIGITTNAYSFDGTRSEKLQKLMKLQGMYDMIEQQRSFNQEQAKVVGSNMMKQLAEGFPDLESSAGKEIQAVYQRFIDQVKPSWTTEEAVAAFGELYGKNITDKELDDIIAFYSSPVGQKDVQSTKTALPAWLKFIRDKNTANLEKATQEYIAELKAVLEKVKMKQMMKDGELEDSL